MTTVQTQRAHNSKGESLTQTLTGPQSLQCYGLTQI